MPVLNKCAYCSCWCCCCRRCCCWRLLSSLWLLGFVVVVVVVVVIVVVVVVVVVLCFRCYLGGREWDFAPEMSDNKVDVWNNIECISPPNTATVHKYVLLFQCSIDSARL